MNTLSNNLLRSYLRCSSTPNFTVIAYMSQSSAGIPTLKKKKPISSAMRAYIDRVKAFEKNLVIESKEYDVGKRFLANIMGEDPATFTSKDVDKTIEYLLPSGLFVPLSRPEMHPPEETIEKAKFDDTGRPFHFLFYTARAEIYELQFEVVKRLNKADKLLEDLHRKGHTPEKEHKMDLITSEWISKDNLKKILNGHFSDDNFEKTMEALEKLANHPMSAAFQDFVMRFRQPFKTSFTQTELPTVQQDEDGRFYVKATGSRKKAQATVIVRTQGEGKIVINGKYNILYFVNVQEREQVLFPLQLTKMLGKVDLDVTVEGGGPSGQAGAIRYATSQCLASLVDEETRTQLQLAGLLTYDRRILERQKFGKRGARRGYTWLKR